MADKTIKKNKDTKHVKADQSKQPLFTDKERKKQEVDKHTRGGF